MVQHLPEAEEGSVEDHWASPFPYPPPTTVHPSYSPWGHPGFGDTTNVDGNFVGERKGGKSTLTPNDLPRPAEFHSAPKHRQENQNFQDGCAQGFFQEEKREPEEVLNYQRAPYMGHLPPPTDRADHREVYH